MKYFVEEHELESLTESEISKEIESLEKRKKELNRRKKLYLSGTIGLVASSTIISTGLGATIFSLCGYSPFKKDDVVKIAYIKTDFDSEGKKEVSKQYEPYPNMKSKVTYYSDWTDVGDKYASVTTTYDVSGYTFEEVNGLVKIKDHPSGEPVEDIVFAEDISDKTSNYYEGTVYESNNLDYIVVPQTNEENKRDIIGGLVVPGVPGAFISLAIYTYQDMHDCGPLQSYRSASRAEEKVEKEIEKNKKKILKIKDEKRVS